MAKLRGPLFSLQAHGTIAGALTFSERKKVSQVRFQKKQRDRITVPRTTQRGYFTTAFAWWHEMSSTEQAGFAGYDDGDK